MTRAENYVTIEFLSRSSNESFARSAAAGFALQLDPTSTTAEHLTEMMTQACGTAATLEDVSSRVPFYIAADSPAIQTLITTYNDVTGENKKPLPWAAVPMRVTSRMPSALARSIPTLSCRNSPVPCTVPTRAPRLKS